MGVRGTGKTTVARHPGELLGVTFLDGDDLHPIATLEPSGPDEPALSDPVDRPVDVVGTHVLARRPGRDRVSA
jgi:hypothetical protein